MSLASYLAQAAASRFEWGKHDCCTFCAEWAGLRLGADLLEGWRGTYHTEGEALERIYECGGLPAIFAEQIGDRAEISSEPMPGDVGIIEFAGDEVGAIFTGERWVMLTLRGIRAIPASRAQCKIAWSVG